MNVALTALWLPILLSAVAVFVTSSIFWMVIQHHNSDWKQLPDEEAARDMLKGVEPGQYSLPHAADGKARQSEEWQQKWVEGPGAMIVIMQTGSLSMGKQLGQWFAYAVIISLLVAYVTSVALPAGANYLQVFRC